MLSKSLNGVYFTETGNLYTQNSDLNYTCIYSSTSAKIGDSLPSYSRVGKLDATSGDTCNYTNNGQYRITSTRGSNYTVCLDLLHNGYWGPYISKLNITDEVLKAKATSDS